MSEPPAPDGVKRASPATHDSRPGRQPAGSPVTAQPSAAAAADSGSSAGFQSDTTQPPAAHHGAPLSEAMRQRAAEMMIEGAAWMEENRLAVRWAGLAVATGSLLFMLRYGHLGGWAQYSSLTELPPRLLAADAPRLPVVLHSVSQRGEALVLRLAHYPLLRRLLDRSRGLPPSAVAQRTAECSRLLTCHLAGPMQPTEAGLQYLQALPRDSVHRLQLLSIVHAADQSWITPCGSATTSAGHGSGQGDSAGQASSSSSGAARLQLEAGGSSSTSSGRSRRGRGWGWGWGWSWGGRGSLAGSPTDSPVVISPVVISSSSSSSSTSTSASEATAAQASPSTTAAPASPPGADAPRGAWEQAAAGGGLAASAAELALGSPQAVQAGQAGQAGAPQASPPQAGQPPVPVQAAEASPACPAGAGRGAELLLWGELYAREARWGLGALLPRRRVDVGERLISQGETAMMEPIDLEWLGVGWERIDRLYAAEQAAIGQGRGMWARPRPSLGEWSRSLAQSAWVRVRHAARTSAASAAGGLGKAAEAARGGAASTAASAVERVRAGAAAAAAVAVAARAGGSSTGGGNSIGSGSSSSSTNGSGTTSTTSSTSSNACKGGGRMAAVRNWWSRAAP